MVHIDKNFQIRLCLVTLTFDLQTVQNNSTMPSLVVSCSYFDLSYITLHKQYENHSWSHIQEVLT